MLAGELSRGPLSPMQFSGLISSLIVYSLFLLEMKADLTSK